MGVLCWSLFYYVSLCIISIFVNTLKIDENRFKQTGTGKFTLILGVQVVSVYSYKLNQPQIIAYARSSEKSCFTCL